jgi:aldose 1-epimerase
MQTVIEFEGKQFPDVVVYTPSAPRQAICIEPYTCPTDAFNLHDRGIECNLVVLQPKEQIRYKISIYAQMSAVVMDSKGGPV